jgi:putative flippase GtrA
MDLTLIYTILGFGLASYSVIANDSVQTLGTFIASNERFKWYWLATSASVILTLTLVYGWTVNDGDITFGRLNKIPYQTIQWYHAAAPLILVILTRGGIPVSTTFLVLSAFASTVILEKVLIKSVVGYGLAATIAYIVWICVSYFINEKFDKVPENHRRAWVIGQWFTTGFLWYTWLSHDVANIAVFLPRQLPVELLVICIITLSVLLFYIFWDKGGKIQKVIYSKTGTRYTRSATIIDFVYAIILLYFKQYNDIPMSTTWVFVGLLCGRELAIATMNKEYKLRYVFPLIGKDFLKMIFGLSVSVGIVLSIHYIFIPNGF